VRRLFSALALAVVGVLVLSGCGDASDDTFIGTGMIDNSFTREVTRIPVGGTVRWSNDGQTVHNAVDVEGRWSTGEAQGDDENAVMQPGERLSMTFDEPGVYEYFCTLHGTRDGEGMFAVLVVGDEEYVAAPDKAPVEPVTEWTGNTLRVPEDHPNIQNAVDAAAPGDLVLVGPAPQDDAHLAPDGRYVWFEQVEVTTPYVTIRGTDRDAVVIDGEHQRPNAISVFAADGVVVENLTVRNATENGIFFTSLTGYRVSYVTAYNSGVYGIYAFDAVDGIFEHSWASGHPDAGFYVGQCDPCDALLTDLVAERNALGYSGTNASDVVIVNSRWYDNIVGIAPNTLDSELLPPFQRVTIVGNTVHDNDNRLAPTLDLEWPAFGNGIMLAGGLDSVVERNLVYNHERSGILVTPNLSTNFWMTGGNAVRDNEIHGSGYADITMSGPAMAGNCFSGNGARRTVPVGLETFANCDGGPRLPLRYELASTFSSVGLAAEVGLGLRPDNDHRTLAPPPAQPGLPGGADAEVRPAVDVFASALPDLHAIEATAMPADAVVDQTKELSVFGVPLAAGAASTFFGLYGYLLPFVLLAAWTGLALWDMTRREDLSKGATVGWVATILLVPFVGPILYYVLARSPIPAWQRALYVGGGLGAYLVILVVGLVVGGVV
jgi:plastocyanin